MPSAASSWTGFPRTVAQAEALDAMLERKDMKLDAVIEFKVDESALLSRIEKRAAETVAAGGVVRPDDNPEVFRTRLDTYRKQTAPLVRALSGNRGAAQSSTA